MSREDMEARWPNIEIYGPQWHRMLRMRAKYRSADTRELLEQRKRRKATKVGGGS